MNSISRRCGMNLLCPWQLALLGYFLSSVDGWQVGWDYTNVHLIHFHIESNAHIALLSQLSEINDDWKIIFTQRTQYSDMLYGKHTFQLETCELKLVFLCNIFVVSFFYYTANFNYSMFRPTYFRGCVFGIQIIWLTPVITHFLVGRFKPQELRQSQCLLLQFIF
jgi:hypothetical protein